MVNRTDFTRFSNCIMLVGQCSIYQLGWQTNAVATFWANWEAHNVAPGRERLKYA
jgi:hypothetical protein